MALKNLFTNVLIDPELAPKLIINEILREPQKIFEKMLSGPKNFVINAEVLLQNPTLANALGLVSVTLSVVSVANEILPIMTKVSNQLIKNPIKVPVVITKELLHLTYHKILAVVTLAKGLIKHPLKTAERMIKGIILSPITTCKDLFRNVKNLFGHSRRKAKRQKRKMAKLQAMQQQIALENERQKKEIAELIPKCFKESMKAWMVKENMDVNSYFTAFVADWKKKVSERLFNGDFIQFVKTVHDHLKKGKFSICASLSPTAHLLEPTPPFLIAHAIAELAPETLMLLSERKKLEKSMEDNKMAADSLRAEIDDFGNVNTSYSATVNAFSESQMSFAATQASYADENQRYAATLEALRLRLAVNRINN